MEDIEAGRGIRLRVKSGVVRLSENLVLRILMVPVSDMAELTTIRGGLGVCLWGRPFQENGQFLVISLDLVTEPFDQPFAQCDCVSLKIYIIFQI